MNLRTRLALAGTALALAMAPLAARADTGLQAGIVAGSTGLGASLGYSIGGGTVLRASSGNFTYNPSFSANGNTYTGHLNLSNVLLEAEFHPNSRTFYYGIGGMINDNTITATTASNNVVIGGTNYGIGTASTTVTWAPLVPYVGIGWSPVHGSGFAFDLGAAFQGNSRASVTSTIPNVTAADLALAQQQIQNAVNVLSVYPVLTIRYTIAF